jgi:hypothetical protein
MKLKKKFFFFPYKKTILNKLIIFLNKIIEYIYINKSKIK